MEKAFDYLEGNIINTTSEFFNLEPKFIQQIKKTLYTGISSTIIHHGCNNKNAKIARHLET